MKNLYAVLIAFTLLFVGTAYAAVPSVVEVEKTIASGDYTKAKEQLDEVLKANPDSIVAAKYYLEVVRIENARDNQPSVEYKLAEDRLAKLEKVKADRLAAENKAKEDKLMEERKAIAFKTFMGLILTMFGGLAGWLLFNRYKAVQVIKREREEEAARQKVIDDRKVAEVEAERKRKEKAEWDAMTPKQREAIAIKKLWISPCKEWMCQN